MDELSRWIYDPAHIAVNLVLIPEVFEQDYLLDQAVEAAAEPVAMPMMMGADGDDVPGFGVERNSTGSMELSMEFPSTFGHRQMEILACTDLIYKPWTVLLDRFPVDGGDALLWIDEAATNATRFYYLNWADDDSDLDGYSDLRERLVMNTDPYVFDLDDSDGDGLQDSYEMRYFHTLAYSGSDDPDQDGLANNEEMVLHADFVEVVCSPVLRDTDGDGVWDRVEIFYGANPSDPSDEGEPPGGFGGNYDDGCLDSEGSVDVSLSLSVDSDPEDSSSGYGMYLGSCELEVTPGNSAGEICTLDKGESYIMSISCLQGGQPWWYDASVSGSGILPSSLDFEGAEDVSETIHAPLFSVESVEGTDVSLDGDARYLSRQSGDVTVTLRLEPGDCPLPSSFSWGSGSANGLSCTISLSDGEEQILFATYNGSQVFLASFFCFIDHSDDPPDSDPDEREYELEFTKGPAFIAVGETVEYKATVTETHGWGVPDEDIVWTHITTDLTALLFDGGNPTTTVTLQAPAQPSASLNDKTIRCEWRDLSAEVEVTVFKIDMVTPVGDPVGAPVDSGDGQNEFTFSSGEVGGLTMGFKAHVVPDLVAFDIKEQCLFTVDSIGSSMKAWVYPGDGQPIAIEEDLLASVIFTGLPESNSDFGGKKVAIYYRGRKMDEKNCEVFFPKNAKNHPGEESGTTPNWFYYWSQTSANRASCTLTYCEALDDEYDPATDTIYISDDTGLSSGISVWGNPWGIDHFGWATAHENKHRNQVSEWGTGSDSDGDWIPDSIEPNYMQERPYDPNNPRTYSDEVGYYNGESGMIPDMEDTCMREQFPPYNLDILWENGSADEEDWGNPGENTGQ